MKSNILKMFACFLLAVSFVALTGCKSDGDTDTDIDTDKNSGEQSEIPSYDDKSDQGLFKFNISCDVADVCDFIYEKKAYYSAGEEIHLSVVVDEGYYIRGYSDSDIIDKSRIITINENKTVVVEIGEGYSYKLGDFKLSYKDGVMQVYDNYILLQKPTDSKFSYFELHDKKTDKKVQREFNQIYLNYLNSWFGEGYEGEWIDVTAHFTVTEEIFVAYRSIGGYTDGQYSTYFNTGISVHSTYREKPNNFITKLEALESVSVKVVGESIEVTGADYNEDAGKYIKVVSNDDIQYKVFRVVVFTIGEKEYYYVKSSSTLSGGNFAGNPKFNVLGTTVEFSY